MNKARTQKVLNLKRRGGGRGRVKMRTTCQKKSYRRKEGRKEGKTEKKLWEHTGNTDFWLLCLLSMHPVTLSPLPFPRSLSLLPLHPWLEAGTVGRTSIFLMARI
jgi:hypothetical protein